MLKTWVRTASIYVDDAETKEEASQRVEEVNGIIGPFGVHIRLPDESSEFRWEIVRD